MKGAYIFSATCPPVNTTVHMEIRIPQSLSTPSVLIAAKMRAQRVDKALPGKRGGGFSVVGRAFGLRQFTQVWSGDPGE